jgi:hypothetical protein
MMEGWYAPQCEPSLEELLADEMMGVVTSRAGTDRVRLRALLSDMAGRLPPERFSWIRPRCAPLAAPGDRPAAG